MRHVRDWTGPGSKRNRSSAPPPLGALSTSEHDPKPDRLAFKFGPKRNIRFNAMRVPEIYLNTLDAKTRDGAAGLESRREDLERARRDLAIRESHLVEILTDARRLEIDKRRAHISKADVPRTSYRREQAESVWPGSNTLTRTDPVFAARIRILSWIDALLTRPRTSADDVDFPNEFVPYCRTILLLIEQYWVLASSSLDKKGQISARCRLMGLIGEYIDSGKLLLSEDQLSEFMRQLDAATITDAIATPDSASEAHGEATHAQDLKREKTRSKAPFNWDGITIEGDWSPLERWREEFRDETSAEFFNRTLGMLPKEKRPSSSSLLSADRPLAKNLAVWVINQRTGKSRRIGVVGEADRISDLLSFGSRRSVKLPQRGPLKHNVTR